MFDPIVYENLKVVLEGAVYDLDLQGLVIVVDRNDQIDLSHLSRTYAIQFRLSETEHITAQCKLHTDCKNWSGEILENTEFVPGCKFTIHFDILLHCALNQLFEISNEFYLKAQNLWDERPTITSAWTIHVRDEENHRSVKESWTDEEIVPVKQRMDLDFKRMINEDQVEDLPELIQLAIQTLKLFNEIISEKGV